jgi:hypothetical protein
VDAAVGGREPAVAAVGAQQRRRAAQGNRWRR